MLGYCAVGTIINMMMMMMGSHHPYDCAATFFTIFRLITLFKFFRYPIVSYRIPRGPPFGPDCSVTRGWG